MLLTKTRSPALRGSFAAQGYGERFAADDDQFDSDDGAVRSDRTNREIEAFLDAHANSDVPDQARTLDGVIRSRRADNAAGGQPVYGHAPFPDSFGFVLAHLFTRTPLAQREAADVIARLEPGVRMSVAAQLRAQLQEVQSVASSGMHRSASDEGGATSPRRQGA